MKLSSIALSLIPTVLGEVISPAEPSSPCHADNCYRAVAGDDVRFDLKSRREDCSSFVAGATAIAYVPAYTAPSIDGLPLTSSRSLSEPTALPVYASLCISVAAYSSACSCWGIAADKFTADAVPTSVATATAIATSLSSAAFSSSPTSNSTSPTSTLPTTKSSVLPSSSLSTARSSLSSIKSTLLSSTLPTTKSSSTTTTPTTIFFSSTFSSTTITPTPTTSTNGTSPGGPCVGGKCGTYKAWPCSGPLGDCLCGIDPDGKSFCFEDNVCSVETNCSVNKDCPASQRCVIGSCCQVGKCVVERKDGICGNANGPRAIFRVRGEGTGRRCEDGRNSGTC
ncbi:hypothetical protein CONLIGDRAFT_696021 [Coniochaeta ligniaria NRRL 30616]|uniref:Uncharacterized protein n=1 Tax=Coniochaeta ligniaria NRRL 30616 TaxID=1408157 RepID=A0A1J7K056_9PEZI|nr:hypothetical protein CONLIGDRAFT_696021 [Coniochaeta ligniaria NRRL 30616]